MRRLETVAFLGAVVVLGLVVGWASTARGPGAGLVVPEGCEPSALGPADDPFAAVGSGPVVTEAVQHDTSPPLRSIDPASVPEAGGDCPEEGPLYGLAPDPADTAAAAEALAADDGVQELEGPRPAPKQVANFEGVGFGFVGPTNQPRYVTPSDNNAAPGPTQVVEMANLSFAIFDKQGTPLYGPAQNNTIFQGFGGQCETRNSGDPVIRFDQLAQRWVVLMPVFQSPWFLCFAISKTTDALGEYHRYSFPMPRFPDYPRLGVWSDGYYVTVSSGDNGDERVSCVHDRDAMLAGEPATQQCFVLHGQFVVPADVEGQALPPAGAPNIQMATGGAQLLGDLDDDGIYFWKFHVDWDNPANSTLSEKTKVPVDYYQFLCGGQLVSCVPQPDTTRRLDSQGDKLMYRLAYRNFGTHQSLVGTHSVNTPAGGGGVRWYEFRVNGSGDPALYQQGTYAPDANYRWMGSITMDRQGNTAVGYSYGGNGIFPGIRFAGRSADDPLGELPFEEGVILSGTGSQTNSLRWDDYTSMQIDPVDDCTLWYTNNYIKTTGPGTRWSTRLAAFRMPDCLRGTVTGKAYYDRNHDGELDPGEPGLPGWTIDYAGDDSGTIGTGADGTFSQELRADALYVDPRYELAQRSSASSAWTQTGNTVDQSSGGNVTLDDFRYTVEIEDRDLVAGLNFGNACTIANRGGAGVDYWSNNKRGSAAKATLIANDAAWRSLVNETLYLVGSDGSRFVIPTSASASTAFGKLRTWFNGSLRRNASYSAAIQLLATALSISFGDQDGAALARDPVIGEWVPVEALVERVGGVGGFVQDHPDTAQPSAWRDQAEAYSAAFAGLNGNSIDVTPANPADCPSPF